jgi:hypothetical protein
MKNTWLLLSLLLVGALAPGGAHAVEDDEEVLAVSPEDAARLWKRVETGSEIDLPGSAQRYGAGCAALSYVIEANGTVSTIRMLHAYPRKEVGDAVAKWLAGWKLEPTESNFEKSPIYTIQIFNVMVKNPDGSSRQVADEDDLASHCAVTIVRKQ